MSSSDPDRDREAVLDAFAKQIGWCDSLGSPFTARLLTILRDDIAAGGASAGLARGWPGDPVADALALRMAAALHALALTDAAPALAASFPPSAPTMEQLRAVVLGAVSGARTPIRAFLASPPQTNEVGRSGVLGRGLPADRQGDGPAASSPRDRRQRRPERHLGSLSLSPRRRGLGRPAERRAHRAKLGGSLASDRRPYPCASSVMLATSRQSISKIPLNAFASGLRLGRSA